MYVKLDETRRWFEDYARGFDLSDPMLEMKYVHSHDVMRTGKTLTRALG